MLRVTDNGCGIAAEVLPHIFDLFTQEGRSLDHAQGGLGIGLTVVRSLAELHGGTVEAASAGIGKGSEFRVVIPLMQSPPLEVPRATKTGWHRPDRPVVSRSSTTTSTRTTA